MFEKESHLEHQYRTEKRWSCFNLGWRKGYFLLPLWADLEGLFKIHSEEHS